MPNENREGSSLLTEGLSFPLRQSRERRTSQLGLVRPGGVDGDLPVVAPAADRLDHLLRGAVLGKPASDRLPEAATDDGAPSARLYYDPRYYAANVLDPDGYSLEFVYKSWQHPQP
jgi:hypothetical protein